MTTVGIKILFIQKERYREKLKLLFKHKKKTNKNNNRLIIKKYYFF